MNSPRVTDLQLQLRDAQTITLVAGARQERLAQAIDEFYATIDAGQPVDRERLLEKYADVADELDDCLRNLDFIQNIAPQLSTDTSGQTSDAASKIAQRTQLGDYQIIREIGRGGMGVVYEAEQMSLGRRVALKVLPFAAMLDKQQLARFKNEARAAATLKHPNIVSVYSIGCERSVHFFAMELVEGRSLAQVVEQLKARSQERGARSEQFEIPSPQPPVPSSSSDTAPIAALTTLPNFSSKDYYRTIAQLGIQAAEALDHAHQNGILHRDIKPANLLVDDTGKLLITDFGLARMDADAGMTMTGDILGTLRYMSPEQALAKRVVVDHRSDIYSLGVTLYELLTLQPAFTGDDRQELLRQIAFEEPRKLRQISRRIPQDLETVVLKSIEKNPTDRYASAQEFADDLRRFVESVPVKAVPPSIINRATKWSRRNSSMVAASAIVMLLLAIVSSISTAFVWRERQRTAGALAQSEDRLRLARTAIDEMYTEVAEKWLSQHGELAATHRQFLEKALALYKQIASERADDPQARFDVACARRRVGNIYADLRKQPEALNSWKLAIKDLEQLARLEPDNVKWQLELATTLVRLGGALLTWNGPVEARPTLERSAVILARLSEKQPRNVECRLLLSKVHSEVGRSHTELYEHEKALREYQRAHDIADALVQETPDSTDYRHELASSLGQLAFAQRNVGRREEGKASMQRAVELRERLLMVNPQSKSYRYGLVIDLCNLHSFTEYDKESLEKDRRAFELARKLSAEFPDRVDFVDSLLLSHLYYYQCLEALDQVSEAEAEFPSLLELAEKHAKSGRPDDRMMLAEVLFARGHTLQKRKRDSEIDVYADRAIDLMNDLIAQYPMRQYYRHILRNIPSKYEKLGDATLSMAKYAEAARHYRDAVRQNPFNDGIALRAALLLLLTNDRDGYKDVCSKMLDNSRHFSHGEVARQTSFACLMSHPPVAEMDQLLKLNELAIQGRKWRPVDLREHGVALYRMGDWNGVLQWCSDCRKTSERRAYMAKIAFLEAMALHQLGKKVEAKAANDESLAFIDEIHPHPIDTPEGAPQWSRPWPEDGINRIYFELLRREAKRLIDP